MKIVTMLVLALLVSACGKDPSSTTTGPCAGADILGTFTDPGTNYSFAFSATCQATLNAGTCQSTMRFSGGDYATAADLEPIAFQISSSTGAACGTAGQTVGYIYELEPMTAGPYAGKTALRLRDPSSSSYFFEGYR